MSSYDAVKKELAAGTPAELICATCPWDRLCVAPPAMTPQDVERLVDEAKAKDQERDPGGTRMPTGALMTMLVFAGKDSEGQLCPVFASRLRADRAVSDGVRRIMRDYQPEGQG